MGEEGSCAGSSMSVKVGTFSGTTGAVWFGVACGWAELCNCPQSFSGLYGGSPVGDTNGGSVDIIRWARSWTCV